MGETIGPSDVVTKEHMISNPEPGDSQSSKDYDSSSDDKDEDTDDKDEK